MGRFLLVLSLLSVSGLAAAQPVCPTGNLISGKRATRTAKVTSGHRLTDNKMPAEGTSWNGVYSAILADEAAAITYDLGTSTEISALVVQADNNDTYEVSLSEDGKTFEKIWTVPKHPLSGMRLRLQQGLKTQGRYVRLSPITGDSSYSASEFQVFCKHPKVWPPAISIELPKESGGVLTRKVRLAIKKLVVGCIGALLILCLLMHRRWPELQVFFYGSVVTTLLLGATILFAVYQEPITSSKKPLILSIIAASLVFMWAIWHSFQRLKGATTTSWFVRGALLSVLFVGCMSWTNFGSFHGPKAIHYWDTFHYYMGGKYFSENRYELLYQCSAIGEVDDGLGYEFKTRKIRDLKDNKLYPASLAVAKADECRAAFKDPERWKAFRQDLRLFRSYMGKGWWAKMFKDHGFNATPVWTLLGRPLTNLGADSIPPPDELVNSVANRRGKSAAQLKEIRDRFKVDRAEFQTRIGMYTALDGLLYAGGFLLIWWAFGLFGCAFAILMWAVGYPWAYFWTGGGFGRVPWWFMAVAGTCFLKRGYPMLGGAGITWSMLLRVFPGALIGGISLKIAHSILKYRRISGEQLRIIIGCTIALVTLVGLSIPAVDGPSAYSEFLTNSMKHKQTPLTNHMGLPTLLSYKSKLSSRYTADDQWAVITMKADRSEIQGKLLTKNVSAPILKVRQANGKEIELRQGDILSVEQDPFKKWKQGRQSTLESRKVLHYGLIALFLAMIWYAGRRLDNWEVTAMSTLLITGVFELTCYYYSYMVLFTLLSMRRLPYMFATIALVISGQVIQLNIGRYDEQYVWETVAVLVVQLFVLAGLCFEAFMADRKTPLGPPVTAGLMAVSPSLSADSAHEPTSTIENAEPVPLT